MDVKKTLLTIAIALIFVFFVGYGIEVFHDSPNNEDYCPKIWDLKTKSECESAGGRWGEEIKEPVPKPSVCSNRIGCYEEFQAAQNKHDKIVFITALIVGLIAVVVGVKLNRDSISTGILAGGVLSILYGTIRYWRHANDILKFVFLGAALAVLIWLGYKKFDKRKKE